jgi:hypothetical protein
MITKEDITVLKNTVEFIKFLKPSLGGTVINSETKSTGEKSGMSDSALWAQAFIEAINEIIERNV